MLEDALAMKAVFHIRGQEHRSHPISAGLGQRKVQLFALLGEEPMRHLDQDSSPIAGVALAAARSAVLQVQQYLDALLDNVMGLPAQHVYDETQAAGIVFVPRIVEPLTTWRSHERRCTSSKIN
jgi:hypothetical protein